MPDDGGVQDHPDKDQKAGDEINDGATCRSLSSSTVAGPHQSTRSTKVRLSHLNPWPSSSSLAYSGSASERHLRYATCEMRSVIVICVSNRHQRPCVYPSINHGVTVTSIAIVRECTRRCLKNTGPCHLSLRLHGIP